MSRPISQVNKDRRAGLVVRQGADGKFVTVYDPEVSLTILERLASGELLNAICEEPGMPSKKTFRRWAVNNPELARAYEAAVKVSAASLEEEALGIARTLQDPKLVKKMTGTEVRAYEVAMNQLRWSASRRDPLRFGERAPANITVPIQINTSLDLGGEKQENIYTVTAKVPSEGAAETPSEPLVEDPHPRSHTGKVILTPADPITVPFSKLVRGETTREEAPPEDQEG